VLLTGSTGYVGALVLERLLRSTNIRKIFIMMRNKKGEDIQVRLQKTLNSSPVLHLLRGNDVLAKVHPIAGDMTAIGLGIRMSDRQQLQAEVDTVIHCAADIRLENGIKDLLLANYEGTKQLLDMSRSFKNLKAFVHVSSAYTNMHATPGSLVQESIYRLAYGDQLVDDHELVQVGKLTRNNCTRT
jgi:fatty acyl-CoA reductase